MFWSRRRISLKTRLALSYALLFFFFCGIIFFLAGYLIARTLNNAGDATVRHLAANIEAAYLMGARFDPLGEILPGGELPKTDRAVLDGTFPGAEVLLVSRSREAESPEMHHTAYLFFRGEYYEFRVRSNGGFFSKKLNIVQHLPRLRRYLIQTIQARGQDHLSITLLNPDGSVWLSSDTLAGGKRPMREEDEFRYMRFGFPGGKTLVIGRSVQEQMRLRHQYTLLFFVILGAATLAGGCAAWLLSRRFIRGVHRMTLAMGRISSGDYSYRIGDMTDNDREILELVETFDAMNERTEKLLEEIRMMSDNVAHDLRTPLTRISGTVELLLCDRRLDDGVRNACVSIAEETARMRDLVNTIMDIARTNSRPDELRLEEFDVTVVLDDFCELMHPAVEEKKLEFRQKIPSGPIPILADRMKFQRVLSNLFENALKFTSRGSVEIGIGEENGEVRIWIRDTGCGIAPEDLKHVFERFYRADASRHCEGNGLGLALVQAIVRAHHWTIGVDSTPGMGSCFTVRIPVVRKF